MAETNGSMARARMDAASIDYPAIAVAVGGILGFVGVYLNWFRYAYPVSGGTITLYLHGSEDWTGEVAFIAGIGAFAFAVAFLLLADPQIRRLTGALMGIGGILLLAGAVAGFFRLSAATEHPLLLGVAAGSKVTIATGFAGGLYVSFIGGVFAVAGTILSLGMFGAREPASS